MEVFLKCLARLRAIADLPEPQTPLIKISLCPLLIASRISFTMSPWVLPLENVRGFNETAVSLGCWVLGVGWWSALLFRGLIEFSSSVFLYKDHMGKNCLSLF